jgi:hypothetical protein
MSAVIADRHKDKSQRPRLIGDTDRASAVITASAGLTISLAENSGALANNLNLPLRRLE